jgi:multicomponent K+:H+ antiporter subunit G
MNPELLPLWVAAPGAALLFIGGAAALAGSIGLLRFEDFFARMHGPSMGNTGGVGSVVVTSILVSSALGGRPLLHEVLIVLFVLGSAPITSIMLLQAGLYRNRRNQR